MSTFDKLLHPDKLGNVRLKFSYPARASQYLSHFNIIALVSNYSMNVRDSYWIYNPLDLIFKKYDELSDFLFAKGIFYREIEVNIYGNQLMKGENLYIDLSKIYERETTLEKQVLQYKFYSVNEIAEMISMSRPTVYKLIDSGELKARRINGQLRVIHSDYINFVNKEL